MRTTIDTTAPLIPADDDIAIDSGRQPATTPAPSRESDPVATEPARPVGSLDVLYAHPGPYTSVYMALHPTDADAVAGDLALRWARLRSHLAHDGSPQHVLSAIDIHLSAPAPDDASGIAVIVAADGTSLVDHGLEPPATDHGVVDTLPHVGPLLEWRQRRIPHLVVTVDEHGADIARFPVGTHSTVTTHDGTGPPLVETVAAAAELTSAKLLIVAGRRELTRDLTEALIGTVGVHCRVVAEPDARTPDELAESTVRLVSDAAARTTVGRLREHRFLAAHDAAEDGAAATVDALRRGDAEVLLVHDDPADSRRAWVGPQPHQLSLEPTDEHRLEARLVDAMMRAAVGQGMTVHIIPTTGPDGPTDDAAVLGTGSLLREPDGATPS